MQVGEPDESLTRFSGLIAVTELVARLGMIEQLDAAVGPIEARDRGFTAGQVLVGMAAVQRCGEDFLVGLDRHRADSAGQELTPVPGLASTTAAGLARRVTEAQWAAVETGLGDVHATALDLLDRLDPDRAHALSAEVTIDMDTSDVEVYGRLKRGVAFNHQGQRVGRPVAPRPRRPISRTSRVLGVPSQQGRLAAWGSRLRPDTDRRADTHRGVREVHGGGGQTGRMSPVSRGRKGKNKNKTAKSARQQPVALDLFSAPDTCDCPACSGVDFDARRLIDEVLTGAADLVTSADPLEAELAGSVFMSIGAMAGEEFNEALVGELIPAFEARACPETVAMLLAIGSVAADRVGKAASAAADRLVEAGVPRPGWAGELGHAGHRRATAGA